MNLPHDEHTHIGGGDAVALLTFDWLSRISEKRLASSSSSFRDELLRD